MKIRINKKRYFLVSYIANSFNGHTTGLMDFKTKKYYLNRDLTLKQISDKNKDLNLEQIVITNIIEISENDYNDWNKENNFNQ